MDVDPLFCVFVVANPYDLPPPVAAAVGAGAAAYAVVRAETASAWAVAAASEFDGYVARSTAVASVAVEITVVDKVGKVEYDKEESNPPVNSVV